MKPGTNFRSAFTLAFAVALSAAACGDDNGTGPIVQAGEATLLGNLTVDRTLHSDTVYTLKGFVKVANGATLTIQPGTRIIGDVDTPGSALWILRGARIQANGTRSNPIVFTSGRTAPNRKPGDWGGLVIVGNATINRTGPVIVEGSDADIDNGGAPGVIYGGGSVDGDNSGTLRYVRVEFAGYAVIQDNELNSFTFAAVGSGTTLEFLQSMAGLDDSFEWFGGTVNGRYLVSYESGDDHFDASEGYRGRNQFLIALQTTLLQPRVGTGGVSGDPAGFEIDGCAGTGCTDLHNSAPFNMPVFANFTVIGPGPGVFQQENHGIGAVIRRGTGGVYVNGIIGRWRLGLTVRDAATDARRQADSLNINNVLFVNNETTLDPAPGNFTQPANFAGSGIDSLAANVLVQSLFTGLPGAQQPVAVGSLDWSLSATSPARSGGMSSFTGRIAARAGTFITPTVYRGAADPTGDKWWEGWTVYAIN